MKDVVTFTIVQDEPEFLPHWLAWYGAAGDTFVLDHDSHPPVPDGVRVAWPVTYDHGWYMGLAQQTQARLLEDYRVVVFATADEFLVPAAGTLREYLQRITGPVTATGYDVVDMGRAPWGLADDRDRPLAWDRPLMPQRRWWVRAPSYDKPLIVTGSHEWIWGFHPTDADLERRDPDLWLLHLHRSDYANTQVRHARKRSRPLHSDITVSGSGGQNLLVDGPEYDQWFYGDAKDREPIPPAARCL